MNATEAVRAWRTFAENTVVDWRGDRRTWAEHIRVREGFADEETLLQPIVFPRFAEELLGFVVGDNLAAEVSGASGETPDFTPADPVTHPFVFETKSTSAGSALLGFDPQVRSYLESRATSGTTRVVLTNLVGIRVRSLDGGALRDDLVVDLRRLLSTEDRLVADTSDAEALASFLRDFRFHALTSRQKLERVRKAPEWDASFAFTSADWLSRRLDIVVGYLHSDVRRQLEAGRLSDTSAVGASMRSHVVDELRHLEWRAGAAYDAAQAHDLGFYLSASRSNAEAYSAVEQYIMHVAYYSATRLLLVRIWEDLGLVEPVLYDQGFDRWMTAFRGVVQHVVDHSYRLASERYRALFERENAYTWYAPTDDTYADVIYELAFTYFGAVHTDILGVVYERLLARIDRKLLGQYYTPRDVIALIWDMMDLPAIADASELSGRAPRIIDVATGSGGFLVEAARRLRRRLQEQMAAGADVDVREWVSSVSEGLNGVEIQRFPAYLAELNLLIQLGQLLSVEPSLKIPPIGVLAADTLSLHNPIQLFSYQERQVHHDYLLEQAEDRRQRAEALSDPLVHDFLMDAACGNPPYVGQKQAARLIRQTRHDYPYWENYVGLHMDYLYWFLILGVSKLRRGGRFGFITTEYWLRASGAAPLRRYLARRCAVERILLFRNLKLFPDAPGQHSMVITGQRTVEPDGELAADSPVPDTRPIVSVYDGPGVSGADRQAILEAMHGGRSAGLVRSFRSALSPNQKEGDSWAEVILDDQQLAVRTRLRASSSPLSMHLEEGIITGCDRLTRAQRDQLPPAVTRGLREPAGVFVLTNDERASLGRMVSEEEELLYPLINTQHVYPYAAVLPPNPDWLVYSVGPSRTGARNVSTAELIELPFPEGLPRIEAHMRQFRNVLQPKVERWGERRPWWSLHRPRPDVVARSRSEGEWARYCLLSRWGAGGQLTVGLAPSGTVPNSGLHSIYDAVAPAEYLCGLLNSTPVQELASTFGPGQLRSEELESLELPFIASEAEAIVQNTLALASTVRELVTEIGGRFPGVLAALRSEISLDTIPLAEWLPVPGPRTRWGRLADVGWTTAVSGSRSRERVREVSQSSGLFGDTMELRGQTGSGVVHLQGSVLPDIVDALRAYLSGLAVWSSLSFSELPAVPVPTDPQELVGQYRGDCQVLLKLCERYHVAREAIDNSVEGFL